MERGYSIRAAVSLLRDLSGPTCPSSAIARAAREHRQHDPYAGEGCSGAHQGELEHNAIRSKASRPDQGGARGRAHSQTRRIRNSCISGFPEVYISGGATRTGRDNPVTKLRKMVFNRENS